MSKRQFQFFCGQISPNRVAKTVFIVNNPRILKAFTYYEIIFHSLKITFETGTKVRATHFNIAVDAAGLKGNMCKVVLKQFFSELK